MTTKLYRIVETYWKDGEADEYTSISDQPADEITGQEYTLQCSEVTKENVSATSLGDAIDSELENANHHYMVGMGAWLAEKLEKIVGQEQATNIMWELVQDKGLMWEF